MSRGKVVQDEADALISKLKLGSSGLNRELDCDLTWYDLKEVSSWFIRIGCELVDLASLQRYTALKEKR